MDAAAALTALFENEDEMYYQLQEEAEQQKQDQNHDQNQENKEKEIKDKDDENVASDLETEHKEGSKKRKKKLKESKKKKKQKTEENENEVDLVQQLRAQDYVDSESSEDDLGRMHQSVDDGDYEEISKRKKGRPRKVANPTVVLKREQEVRS